MSRTHGRADIYVNDDLRWELAIVTEQPTANRLTVKARDPQHPSAWVTVLTLTDVFYVGKNGKAMRWTGTADGETIELTMAPRANAGCSSCGR